MERAETFIILRQESTSCLRRRGLVEDHPLIQATIMMHTRELNYTIASGSVPDAFRGRRHSAHV